MRILVLEDDHEQLEPLQEGLSRVGHIVDGVDNGENALWLCSEKDYDLLIIDWVLPGISGIEVCKSYRQMNKNASVIVLTAKDSTLDKITGLDAGADDYLVKPIDLIELLARIRAIERRSNFWKEENSLNLGGLILDLSNMNLTVFRKKSLGLPMG